MEEFFEVLIGRMRINFIQKQELVVMFLLFIIGHEITTSLY